LIGGNFGDEKSSFVNISFHVYFSPQWVVSWRHNRGLYLGVGLGGI
jgi:hypothetical protein